MIDTKSVDTLIEELVVARDKANEGIEAQRTRLDQILQATARTVGTGMRPEKQGGKGWSENEAKAAVDEVLTKLSAASDSTNDYCAQVGNLSIGRFKVYAAWASEVEEMMGDDFVPPTVGESAVIRKLLAALQNGQVVRVDKKFVGSDEDAVFPKRDSQSARVLPTVLKGAPIDKKGTLVPVKFRKGTSVDDKGNDTPIEVELKPKMAVDAASAIKNLCDVLDRVSERPDEDEAQATMNALEKLLVKLTEANTSAVQKLGKTTERDHDKQLATALGTSMLVLAKQLKVMSIDLGVDVV